MEHRTQIDVLKRVLKSKGITYKKLSQMLEMSEPTIRRMFSKGAFTLERYVKICRIIGLNYEEMIRLSEAESAVFEFTYEQESFFAKNLNYYYFLVVMLRESKTPLEVAKEYNLHERTLTKILAQLERMNLIEWLPGNQVKLLVSTRFRFLEGGPIRNLMERQGVLYFNDANFDGENEIRRFQIIRLSQDSLEKTKLKMEDFFEEVIGDMDRDKILKKTGEDVGVIVAMRPFSQFKESLRNFKA